MYSKKKNVDWCNLKDRLSEFCVFYNNDKGSKVFWLIKSIGNTDWNKR